MPLSFREKIDIEQFLAVETEYSNSVCQTPAPMGLPFDAWLAHQLNDFKNRHPQTLSFSWHWSRRAFWVLMCVFTVLGFFSVSGLIADIQHINLVWLMGALIGTHFVALMLWLIFILLLRATNPGMIASTTHWLFHRAVRWLQPKSTQQKLLFAWWSAIMHPALRRWQLGVYTHSCWLAFLMGNILGLLTLFITRQYDFIWQSTLLSPAQFTDLFTALGSPLSWFGISIPTTEIPAAEQRKEWAWFILYCFVFYATLPRLIVLLLTKTALHWKQTRWNLDYSDSRFIHLQAMYTRSQISNQVLDPDPQPNRQANSVLRFSSTPPPSKALWYGFEVNPEKPWQDKISQFQGLINDQNAFEKTRETIHNDAQPTVFFLESHRLPDRGQIRKLKSLQQDNSWLAIIETTPMSEAQYDCWLAAASKLSWDPQQIYLTRLAP